ncbi:glycosyltransferase [Massilia sp.]|uniref:glycosyltransferase n=1 Tax=Massilia sp. TaxID=1882437 RepID=UPI0028B14642|nr:glycosyltransferase [Massilia sp.]
MRLVIDLQSCQGADPAHARFHLAEALALVRLAAGHEVWLLLNGRMDVAIESIRRAFDGLLPQERIAVFDLPQHSDEPWWRRAAEQVREGAAAALQPDLLYVPDVLGSAYPAALTSITSLSDAFPTVVSLAPGDGGADPAWHRRAAILRNAALVLLTGGAGRARAAYGLDEGQVAEVALAIREGIDAGAAGAAGGAVVVHADAAQYETVLAAFVRIDSALRQAHTLVLAGAADQAAQKALRAQAKRFGMPAQQLHFVRDEDTGLDALYGKAAVVLCVGDAQSIAGLDALAHGVAVIAAQDSPLAALIGEPRALFATNDAAAIADVLDRVLAEPALRAQLAEQNRATGARPTMSVRARQLWDHFEAQYAAHAARRSTLAALPLRRPRLAYVSPLPPARSGIADYSAELVPELARYYDVDLVVDQDGVSDPYIAANFPLRSVTWFDAHAHEFDRVLYHFGNSPFHQHMFPMLERHPGIVVLHDFYLGNIVHHLCEHGYLPGLFRQSLYYSHGFSALADLVRNGLHAAVWKYPNNKPVLDQAVGVIVHARYPQQLACEWYGPSSVRNWATLPLLRGRRAGASRAQARQQLGLSPSEFVVCTFGMLGPTKRNTALLAAWGASPLAQDPHCRLVFVGSNDGGAYGREFLLELERMKCAGKAELTGFVDTERYALWLAACDVAVQLRSKSRGETSAAVLDCLLHGLPTIVNAHGANAELPADVMYRLSDDFSQEELIEALTRLHADPLRRADLAACASAFIEAEHAPAAAGRRYVEAIEGFAAGQGSVALCQELARTVPPAALPEVARALGANARPQGLRQMLVDISALVQSDYKTGIQRVVRSVLHALLEAPPPGWRIEPVYTSGAGTPYRYARRFTAGMLGITDWQLDDAPIDALPGDIFLGLDLATHWTRLNEGRLRQFRERGVQVYFVVYDILPILRPDVFLPNAEHDFKAWLPMLARVSDGLLCISRAVADEVAGYLGTLPPLDRRPLKLGYFHLGADIQASAPTTGLPPGADEILARLAQRPSFLIVGTLEPRKGHLQVLGAFEQLWAEGLDVNLVIVGKRGWMVETLAARLEASPQRGERLFWFENASDEMLLKLYAASDALLAASEGEGFGLPLIEAAQHGVPIIARALPVFREVAGEFAYYFDGPAPADLAAAIRAWLALQAEGRAPASKGMPWLNWAEATGQLLDCVLGQRWYRSMYESSAADVSALNTRASRQLLVDVSTIARNDLRTGIERVVRAQLYALLCNPPPGVRVEPVFLNLEGGQWRYRYARQYADRLLAGAGGALDEAPVQVAPGDWLYCADYNPDAVTGAAAQGLYAQWRQAGVNINFLVHDLLPVLRPEFFPPGAEQAHGRWLAAVAASSDRVICISRAVADEFRQWVQGRDGADVELAVLHHGADLGASAPNAGLADDAEQVLARIGATPSFLMVGTVEPRKGHLQALAAFDALWAAGSEAQLVVVGKEGWSGLPDSQRRTIPQIVERLRKHPELGRRLIWLEGISDEYLERVYAAAACLLVPSEGEGFGLPLIEGAGHGLPILARDLPVFREVAGEHASYFAGTGADQLAGAIREWLALHAAGKAPASAGMRWRSWGDNARDLVDILEGRTAPA